MLSFSGVGIFMWMNCGFDVVIIDEVVQVVRIIFFGKVLFIQFFLIGIWVFNKFCCYVQDLVKFIEYLILESSCQVSNMVEVCVGGVFNISVICLWLLVSIFGMYMVWDVFCQQDCLVVIIIVILLGY